MAGEWADEVAEAIENGEIPGASLREFPVPAESTAQHEMSNMGRTGKKADHQKNVILSKPWRRMDSTSTTGICAVNHAVVKSDPLRTPNKNDLIVDLNTEVQKTVDVSESHHIEIKAEACSLKEDARDAKSSEGGSVYASALTTPLRSLTEGSESVYGTPRTSAQDSINLELDSPQQQELLLSPPTQQFEKDNSDSVKPLREILVGECGLREVPKPEVSHDNAGLADAFTCEGGNFDEILRKKLQSSISTTSQRSWSSCFTENDMASKKLLSLVQGNQPLKRSSNTSAIVRCIEDDPAVLGVRKWSSPATSSVKPTGFGKTTHRSALSPKAMEFVPRTQQINLAAPPVAAHAGFTHHLPAWANAPYAYNYS